ncbi:hypothetical protein P121_gp41 [Pelagibacter phage HTVC121P]|nr:hypothetical protein P121_gp41 [Pelagibacter phage HTVC121P]
MCNIGTAIQVASLVHGYREKKAQNKAIRRDQETSRRGFDRGYLHDMNKIDQEKVNADKEKLKAEIKSKAEKNLEISQKTNLGFGNSTKIVQSIGYLFDEDWIAITSDYDKDVQTFKNQQTEAYANLHKGYNSLTSPVEPSRTGLILDIGSTVYEGYQADKKQGDAKK